MNWYLQFVIERNFWLPLVVISVALFAAIGGGFFVRDFTDTDAVNFFVESLSGNSASFMGTLGSITPLGFSFGAGMAAAFNPCGFAMLPAYIGLFLGLHDGKKNGHTFPLLVRSVVVGFSVTGGFVLLFVLGGIFISLGARSALGMILPWLGLVVGILLILGGAWIMGGRIFYVAIAQQLAQKIELGNKHGVRGYFLFGVSYGIASLGCTLPIFLSVVGTSFAVHSLGSKLTQFLFYSFGMGFTIIVITLGIALFQGALTKLVQRLLPYIERIGSFLMIISGMYIVFYWISIGGIF